MINNIQHITAIETNKRICLFCPIGKDFYTADIFIKFMPADYYMDYIKLDEFLNHLSGLSLTIEELIDKVYKDLQNYKPYKCSVTVKAYSNTHLDVTVTKGDNI